jgi:hypothetical protein
MGLSRCASGADCGHSDRVHQYKWQIPGPCGDLTKVHRTTKLLVLSKAKVMSYEYLVEARAKRAEKDARRATKKQQRKCKGQQKGVLGASSLAPHVAVAKPDNDQLWMPQAQHSAAPVARIR